MSNVFSDLVDESGVTRLRVKGAGGGSLPGENLYGNNVSIADTAQANLTFDGKNNGADLLDLSVPDTPTIITPGVYVVTVTVGPNSAMTPGGFYQATLTVGLPSAPAGPVTVPVTAGYTEPATSLSVAWNLAAGDPIQVAINNFDGGGSPIDFALFNAIVQPV